MLPSPIRAVRDAQGTEQRKRPSGKTIHVCRQHEEAREQDDKLPARPVLGLIEEEWHIYCASVSPLRFIPYIIYYVLHALESLYVSNVLCLSPAQLTVITSRFAH